MAAQHSKRGNPGLKGRLVERSVEAYILALETINRLSARYRIETFAYLLCNAWELLLKAKIIEDTGNKREIYYKQKIGTLPRTLSLDDCLKRVFPNDGDPVRRNVERAKDLRDEAVHLVISQVPRDVIGLFQACVLNYHKSLIDWFEIPLSDRVPVGMMSIVYDLAPEQFDLTDPVLRRQLGRETADYLARLQSEIDQEFLQMGRPAEFAIDIQYKLALVKNVEAADIVLTSGAGGTPTRLVEVPKDPSKTHPYRQKELVQELNNRFGGEFRVNAYDIQSVSKVHSIRKRPDFFYQGAVKGSPVQYSESFLNWLVDQYERDNEFFSKARKKARTIGASK